MLHNFVLLLVTLATLAAACASILSKMRAPLLVFLVSFLYCVALKPQTFSKILPLYILRFLFVQLSNVLQVWIEYIDGNVKLILKCFLCKVSAVSLFFSLSDVFFCSFVVCFRTKQHDGH
jgi:hypothetical protein